MNETQLNKLLKMNSETEVVEFKEAKTDFSFDKLGKYFSALANEANLQRKKAAWLVFGVEDTKHEIVGTGYRSTNGRLEYLKKEITPHTSNNISFRGIYPLEMSGKRVILFEIPPAPKWIPVAWKGHYYGRDFTLFGTTDGVRRLPTRILPESLLIGRHDQS